MGAPQTIKKGKRLGWAGHADLFATIQRDPMTARQLSELLGINQHNINRTLYLALDLGLVHRCGWTRRDVAKSWTPVWRFGGVPCTPYPGAGSARRPCPLKRDNRRFELFHIAAAIRMLQAEPVSIKAISEQVGANWQTIAGFLRRARAVNFARVADWETRHGSPTPLWVLGEGPDCRRPATMPRKEVERRYRLAKRAKLQTMQVLAALTGRAQPAEEATA